MRILAGLAGLGSLICWIVVVIKMFQKEGVLNGILAIICSLYAYIWGWMHQEDAGKQLMIGWTVCILICIAAGMFR